MTSKRVTFKTTECADDVDLVSQTEWVEEAPTVFIAFPSRNPTDPRRIACYNGSNLGRWISDQENTFAQMGPKRCSSYG